MCFSDLIRSISSFPLTIRHWQNMFVEAPWIDYFLSLNTCYVQLVRLSKSEYTRKFKEYFRKFYIASCSARISLPAVSSELIKLLAPDTTFTNSFTKRWCRQFPWAKRALGREDSVLTNRSSRGNDFSWIFHSKIRNTAFFQGFVLPINCSNLNNARVSFPYKNQLTPGKSGAPSCLFQLLPPFWHYHIKTSRRAPCP